MKNRIADQIRFYRKQKGLGAGAEPAGNSNADGACRLL